MRVTEIVEIKTDRYRCLFNYYLNGRGLHEAINWTREIYTTKRIG